MKAINVRLAELNIIGFKSFAKKANIQFHDGITSIVGPNGCGKSNVVDAIRWVMGEQRSGALRSERMENVIFNGSASAKPVGMSEVSLKIFNDQNILPVEYSEVLITRRLFRSGESQYAINGNTCRLKDILDLFMDTGVGPGTYSVIELAQVEKILNGKDDERRRIFEEAAGITKYKLRRRATFRKLEATEKDLLRIEDIMSEVEKSVRSLRRQVSRAEKYQEMSKELKGAEISLALHDYTTLLSELEPLETKLSIIQDEREGFSTQLASLDADYESSRTRLLSLEKKLSEEQRVYNELERESQKFDERILVNKERLRSLEENLSRYAVERKNFIQRLDELQTQLTTTSQENKKAEESLAKKQSEYKDANQKYQALRAEYDQYRNRVREAEVEILSITEIISRKQNEGERMKANEENLSNRLKQLETENDESQHRYRELVGQLHQAKADEEKIAQTVEQQKFKLKKMREQEEEARRSFEGLQKTELQDKNRIEVLENQVAMVRRLIDTFEDYPAGVRYLATKNEQGFENFGPFANALRMEPEHRSAISAALSEAATFLLVNDVEQALQGIDLLKQDKKGVVSFLPVQNIKSNLSRRKDFDDLGVIGWANELVSTENRYKSAVDAILGSFLVVQDLQTAQRLFDDFDDHPINLVTLGGEVMSHWGLVRGGGQNKNQAEFIGRQEQLEKLEHEILQIREGIEKRSRTMSELQEDAHAFKIDAENVEKQIQESEESLANKRIELGRLNYEQQSLDEARDKRDQERQRLLQAINELGRNLEQQSFGTEDLQAKRQKLIQEATEKGEKVKELEKQVNSFGADVQAVSVELARVQSNFEATQRERESISRQIRETEALIDTRADETERAKQEITDLSQVNQEYSERIQELYDKMQVLHKRLEELEEQQYQANTDIADKEKQIRAIRSKTEELSEVIHNHQLRVSELRMSLSNLRNRMKEEYEFELTRQEIDTDFEPQSTRQTVEELREKIKSYGPVNLLALKEYEQENERLLFLQKQKDDLNKSQQNLTETIDLINKTARERFLATFEEIQKNFTQVFKSFFEGGRASLVLREGNDPLEADIDIYATPGGKRLSALTLLSGGEKSLTAISLLFAIYLVKPSPFCIFDEVDAPLDDQNVKRFTNALKSFSNKTQFIVVTHNKLTMRSADQLYGVTMEEEGVSKVVSVKFEKEKDEIESNLVAS